jgi:flagellar biosynthesis protein FliR
MLQIPIEPVLTFILVLMRVLFLFAFMPVYGDVFTPMRARILVAVAVAFVMAPLVEPGMARVPATMLEFVGLISAEALLGIAFGLTGRITLAAIQFAGAIIGKEIGFQAANIIDPAQSAQVPVVGQLLYLASLLVFLGVGGDGFFIGALARSFELSPPGMLSFSSVGLVGFFNVQATEMYTLAVQLSLPIIAVIFVTNAGMGMLNKAVPQMHVFLESFPVKIMLGLFMLSILCDFMVNVIVERFGILKESVWHLLEIIQ